MCEIRVGGEGRESVSVQILGRECGACEDYWDGNWLNTHIEVSVGGFGGVVECTTRVEEFGRFEEQLRKAYEALSGQAEFETLEGQLSLTFIFGNRGEVSVRGVLMDQAGMGNRLNFGLELDQSFVPPALGELARVRETYPLRGRPATG